MIINFVFIMTMIIIIDFTFINITIMIINSMLIIIIDGLNFKLFLLFFVICIWIDFIFIQYHIIIHIIIYHNRIIIIYLLFTFN